MVGNRLNKIYCRFTTAHYGIVLKTINGILYSVSEGVFKKQNSGWERLIYGVSPLSGLSGIGGTHQKNLFAVGIRSQVWHYNGVDWYRYPQFTGNHIDFSDVWTDGEQVFIVGNDGLRTYIIRGK